MCYFLKDLNRSEAIASGDIKDVSELAKEAGFRIPLAVTKAVWEDCIAWPKEDGLQDETGRAWDVIFMASRAAVDNKKSGEPFAKYQIYRVKRGEQEATLVDLVLFIGPGEHMEPICTVYLLEEVEDYVD